MQSIIRDTKQALNKAFPHFENDVSEYHDMIFVTVLDQDGEDVPDTEILAVLEKAQAEAQRLKVDDVQWRALSHAVSAVREADRFRIRRKEWQELEEAKRQYTRETGKKLS